MSEARRSHTRAVVAFVAVLGCIGASFGACTNYQRANGEGCLKDIDCLSNLCLAQVCSSPAPIAGDSGSSAPEDSGGGTDTGTPGTDSGGGKDSASSDAKSSDSGTDGPAAPVDSGLDSPLDSPVDSPVDSSMDSSDGSLLDAADASNTLDASDGSIDLDGSDGSLDASDAADALDALNDVSLSSQLA